MVATPINQSILQPHTTASRHTAWAWNVQARWQPAHTTAPGMGASGSKPLSGFPSSRSCPLPRYLLCRNTGCPGMVNPREALLWLGARGRPMCACGSPWWSHLWGPSVVNAPDCSRWETKWSGPHPGSHARMRHIKNLANLGAIVRGSSPEIQVGWTLGLH